MTGGKRGRPRKEEGTEAEKLFREYWRNAAKRYYSKNRDKVLENAKQNKVKENVNYTRAKGKS